jgi:RNA polymerase sigma-70 factor (ECF subfamily)
MGRPLDRRDVDHLVVEHLPAALRFARRLTGDPLLAEEVVQEALCRVLARWQGFRGASSFRTWLLSIVVNTDRDRRRRVRTSELLEEGALAGTDRTAEELIEAGELHASVLSAIERLPSRQREVAALVWGEGLAAGDAAAVLEISEASVYTNIHLARKQIAAAIGLAPSQRKPS